VTKHYRKTAKTFLQKALSSDKIDVETGVNNTHE